MLVSYVHLMYTCTRTCTVWLLVKGICYTSYCIYSVPAAAMHMMSQISSLRISHSNRSFCTNLNGAEADGSSCHNILRISRRNSVNLRMWSHRSNSMASPNRGEETRTLWEGPLSSPGFSFFSSCCSFKASFFNSCSPLSRKVILTSKASKHKHSNYVHIYLYIHVSHRKNYHISSKSSAPNYFTSFSENSF